MKYLVLGANGYIGHYLYSHMKRDGIKVIGTARDCHGKEDFVYFDILNDYISNITERIDDKEKTAIICIAQTCIDKCKTEYEFSRQINVEATKNVVEKLVKEGFFIIYFSTDNVFDGEKGNYTELDKTNAINQYGRMKEEMEKFLINNYSDVCIFRLPKVLGVEKETQNLLTDLENKSVDKTIKCIRNMKMSIISKQDVYHACLIAATKRLHGVYNLSSGEIYSRKELTEIFYKSMGIYDRDVVELEQSCFGFKDMRPLNVGLNNSKFMRATGYEFESFDTIAEQYIKKNRYKTVGRVRENGRE